MREWKGLKVPVEPKREWGSWMCRETTCPGVSGGVDCRHACPCVDCIYARRHWEERRCFYEQWYGKYPTSAKNELPKLTAEIFKRADCPDWARWAAVDANGIGYLYAVKPYVGDANRWHSGGWYDSCGEFDASDWKYNLIERPRKELPKLTQTAFHCPDCPKEAAKLKVFPANHVVALDKDNKVLSVMELQCEEGEVNKTKTEWYYNKEADILYYGKDFEYTNLPVGADPVKVSYLLADILKGTAVRKVGVTEDFLIVDVKGSLVTLAGVKGKDFISMITLILNYRITCSGDRCCEIRPLQ